MLQLNGVYEVLDPLVPQGLPYNAPRLLLHEMLDYKGAQIIIATKFQHEQHVYMHGFEVIPSRASCMVVPLHETSEELIYEFSRSLKGYRMVLRPDTSNPQQILCGDTSFINWSYRLAALPLTSIPPLKDELIEQARAVVDIYYEYKLLGKLPLRVQLARDILL